MRILVIEDEPKLGDYLKKGLEENGYVVDVARDGIEGKYLATEGDYALILLDVMLPGIDGFSVLQALRRTKNVPVLVLTARDKVEDRVLGLQQGADDYLVKPFSARELIARVGAHLELGRVRRDAEERFRAMADLAPALIWVADAQGQRGFLNAGWREFTGADPTEDLEHRWRERLHPEDHDRYLEVVSPAVERPPPRNHVRHRIPPPVLHPFDMHRMRHQPRRRRVILRELRDQVRRRRTP